MNYYFSSINIVKKIENGFIILCSFKRNNLIKEVEFDYFKDDEPEKVIKEMKEDVSFNIKNEDELINIIKIFNNLNTKIIKISN